jgi:hypothetical protein
MQNKTDIELKALAYDQLATIEMCQNNLKLINQELAERSKKEPVETPKKK